MERIETLADLSALKENRVIGGEGLILENTTITFRGTGNILYLEKGVHLQDSSITFGGDNALVYLSRSNRPYVLSLSVFRDTTAFFGPNCHISGKLVAVVSERQCLLVGRSVSFSFGVALKTSEPHPIYSIETNERINPSRSICIGDHVWVCQNCFIQKGTVIGSGSILGAHSVFSGQQIPSNTYWEGNPAQLLHTGVFYTNESVHNWTDAQTAAAKLKNKRGFIFRDDGIARKNYEKLDIVIRCQPTIEARLEQVKLLLADTAEDHNRFFIPCPEGAAALSKPGIKKKGLFRR